MPSKAKNKAKRAKEVLEQAAECAQRRSQGEPSEIAERLGITQQTLGDRLRLHDAPDEIKNAVLKLGVAVIQHLLRHYHDDPSHIMELICGAIKPNGQIDEVGYEVCRVAAGDRGRDARYQYLHERGKARGLAEGAEN